VALTMQKAEKIDQFESTRPSFLPATQG